MRDKNRHSGKGVLCHKRTLSHEQATASHHDGERLVRESPAGGYVYVDKTAYLHSLVRQEGTMCFLSRPRRFGKSLTVSTLEAVFQGRRELCKGLTIDALDYDWKKYPVIHIDFTNCWKKMAEGLKSWLKKAMIQTAVCYGIAPLDQAQDAGDVFSDLIDGLSALGKVVVLIDEYDKVLSDNVFSPEVEKSRQVLA